MNMNPLRTNVKSYTTNLGTEWKTHEAKSLPASDELFLTTQTTTGKAERVELICEANARPSEITSVVACQQRWPSGRSFGSLLLQQSACQC
jgi:hypothetical protein